MNIEEALKQTVKEIQSMDKETLNKKLKESSQTSFAQTVDQLIKSTEGIYIYCDWTIIKGDFSNWNIKCPKNLVTGSYMSLSQAKHSIDSLLKKV